MSGHSKWHNIQAKKGKADAAKGRIFTKLGREIAVAAKSNPNPETNSKLADIIAKAKAANMPNDNIQRSIKKASGEMSGADYKELTYEGYGVAGSAVIIVTLTDNINRTAGDVRAILGKHGGSMGEVCSIALICGGLYLMLRKVISPIIPFAFIGTVAATMFLYSGGSIQYTAYQLLGGGLMLGAFFMATDYTTCPINKKGKLVFGIGCGLITFVIRVFGALPEGVSFSIILMNILVPHIENLCAAKPFGTLKEKKSKKEEKKA